MDAPSYYCMECRMAFLWYTQGAERPNYCPSCGAYACIVPGEFHNGYGFGPSGQIIRAERYEQGGRVESDSPASKSSEVTP